MAPKRPRDIDSEDDTYERKCKRKRLFALKVKKQRVECGAEKPTVAVKVLKRFREELNSDSESVEKKFKIVPGTSKVATDHMKETETKNTSNIFNPLATNPAHIKALIKHHTKRYNRFNPTKTNREAQSIKAISLGEVEAMCLKAMKAKEEQLKSEYESVLSSRMMELYESFLKFNSDVMDPVAIPSSYLS